MPFLGSVSVPPYEVHHISFWRTARDASYSMLNIFMVLVAWRNPEGPTISVTGRKTHTVSSKGNWRLRERALREKLNRSSVELFHRNNMVVGNGTRNSTVCKYKAWSSSTKFF